MFTTLVDLLFTAPLYGYICQIYGADIYCELLLALRIRKRKLFKETGNTIVN